MIMGICADIINETSIKLLFFDDTKETPSKLVDIKNNNVYNFIYNSNGATYESVGKVSSIIIDDDNYNKNTCCHVREYIGQGDYTYTNMPKEDFVKSPPIENVYIIVDTSETFDGNYESIALDSIINCDLISSDSHYEYEGLDGDIVIDSNNVIVHQGNSTITTTIEDVIKMCIDKKVM